MVRMLEDILFNILKLNNYVISNKEWRVYKGWIQ